MCPYIAVAITVASTYCAYGLPTRNGQPELVRVVWLYSKKRGGTCERSLPRLRNVGHDSEVSKRLDAFDQWCLRHILRVSFTAHVTNQEVRRRSTQLPVTQTVMLRHLRFFGHVIRSDSDEDHTRALNAGINDPPKEWKRPRGRPRQTCYARSGTTSNIRTWDCGRPGTELMTVISGVVSWKQ